MVRAGRGRVDGVRELESVLREVDPQMELSEPGDARGQGVRHLEDTEVVEELVLIEADCQVGDRTGVDG